MTTRSDLVQYEIAHAASMDAGTRSMRLAGRAAWNAGDWNVACVEFDRLRPLSSPSRGPQNA